MFGFPFEYAVSRNPRIYRDETIHVKLTSAQVQLSAGRGLTLATARDSLGELDAHSPSAAKCSTDARCRVSRHPTHKLTERLSAALRGWSIQDAEYGLPRIYLPDTSLHKARRGRAGPLEIRSLFVVQAWEG
jgi:hypothetical protein